MYLFAILYTLPYILFNNINYDYTNRILSTINSLYVSIAAICFQNNLVDYSVLNYAIKTGSMWFASDIMFMYFTEFKNAKLYYLHHVITILFVSMGFTNFIPEEYICALYLTEITTSFLNISWYLNEMNLMQKYMKTTTITWIFIIISWTYYRICLLYTSDAADE